MKSLALLFLFAVAALAADPNLNKPIAELKLRDGRTLKNVQLISYAASAVMAKWEGGRGTLRYEDFPDEYQTALTAERPKASAYVAPPPKPKQAAATPAAPTPAAAKTVNGQLYVMTVGAGAYKFAGSHVRVYPAEKLEGLLYAQQAALPLGYRRMAHDDARQAEHDAWNEALKKEPMIASAQTDSDGKFALSIPARGSYFVFVTTFRVAGLRSEWKTWVTPISGEGELLLNSSNSWTQPN